MRERRRARYVEKLRDEKKKRPTCACLDDENSNRTEPRVSKLGSESLSDSLFGHLVDAVEKGSGERGSVDVERKVEKKRKDERVGSHDSHELDLIGDGLEDRESDFVTPKNEGKVERGQRKRETKSSSCESKCERQTHSTKP